MKKKWIGWLMGTVAVMFLLPWAAVTFVKRDAGMAATLLLFFVINPVYAMAAGSFAGRNIRKVWAMPVIVSVLFLLGAWTFFDPGEGAFVIYAGVYLVIGIAAMLLSLWINGRKQQP